MEHIFLPHCWVCGVRFITSDPPGPETEEKHHIIPRAAGGVDGPQVSLCGKHHTKLHHLALRLKSKKPYFDILSGEGPEQQKKILWLASRVHNAFEAVRNDPNKQVSVLLTLDKEHQEMMDKLKRVYPSLKSREAILNLALTNLYYKNFLPE